MNGGTDEDGGTVTGILNTTGISQTSFTTSKLHTIRRAIGELDTAGVTATEWNPYMGDTADDGTPALRDLFRRNEVVFRVEVRVALEILSLKTLRVADLTPLTRPAPTPLAGEVPSPGPPAKGRPPFRRQAEGPAASVCEHALYRGIQARAGPAVLRDRD